MSDDNLEQIDPDEIPEGAMVLQSGEVIVDGGVIGRVDSEEVERRGLREMGFDEAQIEEWVG